MDLNQKQTEVNIIKQILPKFQNIGVENFQFQRLRGTSNVIYKVEVANDNNQQQENEIFIMRKMSDKEGFIDRKIEQTIFNTLNTIGAGPQNLGYMKINKKEIRLEEFIKGRHPTMEEYLTNQFKRGLALQMVIFHQLQFSEFSKIPSIMDLCSQESQMAINFNQKINNLIISSEGDFKEKLIQIKEIIKDQQIIGKYLLKEEVQRTINFCHNDLNRLNILCKETQEGKLDMFSFKLIDYEYGCYNFQGFEIANLFNESCFDLTIMEFPYYHYFKEYEATDQQIYDISLYYVVFLFIKTHNIHFLQEQYQCSFEDIEYLKSYLKSLLNENQLIQIYNQVQILENQVKMFLIITNFYWVLWSVNMIKIEEIDNQQSFNYLHYGYFRYQLYQTQKKIYQDLFYNI